MATLADLTEAIDSLIAHAAGPTTYQLVQQVEEKAYEAYVFGLCLRAVHTLGVTPVLKTILDDSPFVYRGSPGKIHSTYRNYGYASFTLNGQEFEIHAGVEFKGTSGMTHEVDVCIMRAADAEACRQRPGDPPAASLIGAWECKFYAGPLQKHLARAFVGLVGDLGTKLRLAGLCSNQTHDQMRLYFQPQRRPYPHLRLSPLNPASENRFVEVLAAELKKMTGS